MMCTYCRLLRRREGEQRAPLHPPNLHMIQLGSWSSHALPLPYPGRPLHLCVDAPWPGQSHIRRTYQHTHAHLTKQPRFSCTCRSPNTSGARHQLPARGACACTSLTGPEHRHRHEWPLPAPTAAVERQSTGRQPTWPRCGLCMTS